MVRSLGPLSFAKSCDISNYVANGFNQVVIGTWGTAAPFNLTNLSELFEHHRLPQRDGVYFLRLSHNANCFYYMTRITKNCYSSRHNRVTDVQSL